MRNIHEINEKVSSKNEVILNDKKRDQCEFEGSSEVKLREHMNSKHSATVIKCEKCDFQSVFQSKLSKHIKVQHEGFRFECESCDITSTAYVTLKSHTDVKNGGKMVMSKSCDFTCKQNNKLKCHVLVKHDGYRYLCDFSEFQTTLPDRLNQHIRVVHEGLGYKCKDKLKKHQRKKSSDNGEGKAIIAIGVKQIVVNKTQFLEYGKSCSLVETYQMYHIETTYVKKVKYFNCRFCDDKTKQTRPLVEHFRTNIGERPANYKDYGQSFKTKKTLTIDITDYVLTDDLNEENTIEVFVEERKECKVKVDTRTRLDNNVKNVVHETTKIIKFLNCTFCDFKTDKKSGLQKHENSF